MVVAALSALCNQYQQEGRDVIDEGCATSHVGPKSLSFSYYLNPK